MTKLSLALLATLLLAACATAPRGARTTSSDGQADVNCDDGLFSIERNAPQGGYVFDWIFRGPAKDLFVSHRAIDGSGGDSVDLAVGSTYQGETPKDVHLDASPQVQGLRSDLNFQRDPASEGYFVRAYRYGGKIAEYYFHHCALGPQYR